MKAKPEMDEALGRVLVQSSLTGQRELSFASSVAVHWGYCDKCHVDTVRAVGGVWDRLGAVITPKSTTLREHVHTGKMGKGSRSRKILARHPKLFEDRD